jgi:hypothetical protein
VEHRTLDRVMDLGVDTPKSIIPMRCVDTMPIRAIGVRSSVGALYRRLDLQHPWLGIGRLLGITIEEGIQLGEFELDGG